MEEEGLIYGTVLIFESIEPKAAAFDKDGTPTIIVELERLATEGFPEDGEGIKLSEIEYIQSATGDCDFIIQLKSLNIEYLMKAINIIRRIDQVKSTETHVGTLLYQKTN